MRTRFVALAALAGLATGIALRSLGSPGDEFTTHGEGRSTPPPEAALSLGPTLEGARAGSHGPSGAPAASTAAPVHVGPAEETRELICRDLSSCGEVADLELTLKADPKRKFRSDRDGRVAVPVSVKSSADLLAPTPWVLREVFVAGVGSTALDDHDHSATLWLTLPIRLRVNLSAEGTSQPPSFANALVRARPVHAWDRPWRSDWPGQDWEKAPLNRFPLTPIAAGPEEGSSSIVLTVPRTPQCVVTVNMPGWYAPPKEVRLPESLREAEVEVAIVVHRGTGLRGTLLSLDGAPIAHARVNLSTYRVAASGAELTEVLQHGGPRFHRILLRKDGGAVLVWTESDVSDAEGRFTLERPAGGDARSARLTTLAPGCLPLSRELGTFEGDWRLEVRLQRAAADSSRVLLTALGQPIQSETIWLEDWTDMDRPAPAEHLEVAPDGTIPSEWLVSGHVYRLSVKRQRLNFYDPYKVPWDGRTCIELTKFVERSVPFPAR